MAQFNKAGSITRDRCALRVDVDGWKLGELVIGARDVSELLAGRAVDVSFVQARPGREAFVGYAGTAQLSRSGKAINVRIESRLFTAPLQQVKGVIDGRRTGAVLSTPAPIIDADRAQREAIDAGLIRSF